MKMERLRGEVCCQVKSHKFNFGQAKCDMPIRFTSENIKQVLRNVIQRCRTEIQVGNKNLENVCILIF